MKTIKQPRTIIILSACGLCLLLTFAQIKYLLLTNIAAEIADAMTDYPTINGPVDITNEYPNQNDTIPQNVFPKHLHISIKRSARADKARKNATPRISQMLSADLSASGHTTDVFNSWQECEDYINVKIPNPLDSCQWLQPTNKIEASWTGLENGDITEINLHTEYNQENIRVQFNATIYGKTDNTKTPQDPDLEIAYDLQKYFFATDIIKTVGPVTYRIYVTGEPTAQDTVKNVADKILTCF